MELTNPRDLVLKLKKARDSKRLSIDQIVQMVLDSGRSLSKSTVTRVFEKGSEDKASGFSFAHTLLPIYEAIIGPWDETEGEAPDAHEFQLLQAELRVQDALQRGLKSQIEILEERVLFMKAQINILKEQIEIKDRRMDEREAVIRKVMAERDELRLQLDALKSKK